MRRTLKKLRRAKSKHQLIEFPLPHEDGWSTGYVAGLSDGWLVLSRVSDDIYFNGFECHRLADLHEVVKSPHRAFIEKALELRQQSQPVAPPIDAGSIQSLIRSANEAFPLIVIHREIKKPGICLIGRVVKLADKTVTVQSIKPGAIWDDQPEEVKLKHITRIDFGGGYEMALHQVAGDPPQA